MFNVAFCDDNKEFLTKIVPEAEKIFKHFRTDICSYTFTNGSKLVSCFKKYKPYYDIIFLDIDMPVKNGKEIAKELRILDKKFKLVFVTAYEQEALNTFQYDVIGFLPKNLIFERLTDIIKLIIERIKQDIPQIQIFKIDNNLNNSRVTEIKMPLDDIMYFESINRKVYLNTKRETFVLHNYQFSQIVHKYLPLGFVDIHRTCIVNIKYIFSVSDIEIELDNGIHLPLSRRKRQRILDKFSEIIVEGESK
jgi:DNA-binding LytR/AlgR family response regulator